MKRVLILYNNTSTYFFDRINKGKIVIKNVFDNKNWMHNKFLCLLRKINSHFTYFFYGDWYRHLNDYEKIIVFDTPFLYDKKLLKNISKRATHCKKFYYSWNIVHDEHLNKIEKKETETYGFKFYCYDKGNCEKYGLNFNTIMYDKTLTINVPELSYDAFFLGFLKDRKDKISQVFNLFNKAGLNCKCVIVKKGDEFRNINSSYEYRDGEVSYYEYLEI